MVSLDVARGLGGCLIELWPTFRVSCNNLKVLLKMLVMSSLQPDSVAPKSRHTKFETTHWSVVLAFQNNGSANSARSLAALCEQYWPPLYAFVRHQGHSEHDAQDLTQAFFTALLEKNWLASADQTRGRFRTFLLTAIKRFMANEWDRSQTIKAGGRVTFVNLDALSGFSLSNRPSISAESLFDRQWALAILDAVLERLQAEFVEVGRAADYELLKPCLTASRNETDYHGLATALGVQPVSARSAVHRLRKRFKELFREQIMHTVDCEAEIDDELRWVIAALGS